MKAFLLAAGLGTRLRPITDKLPKCLVEIAGKPLLAWWIKLFEEHGISEVLINLHHLPHAVKSFINEYPTSIKFNFYFEKDLHGSAGTLRENKSFVENESSFFVCYADNLTNYNLSKFHEFHKKKSSVASLALFETDTPSTKGIVELDSNQRVISFEEKPKNPKSNLANAGIYIFTPSVLGKIPNIELSDIGYDLLPRLVNQMFGWQTSDYLIDIGTFEHLSKAENEWSKIIKAEEGK